MESTETLDVASILRRYKEKQGGAMSDYTLLLNQLEDASRLSDETLIEYMRTLRCCVADLTKEYETFVGLILGIEWSSRNPLVIKEYQSFMLNLISAQTFYLTPCIEVILDRFSLYTKTKDKRKKKVLEFETVAARTAIEQSFVYLHHVLQAIVQIVPMTPVVLVPLVHSYFPFFKVDSYVMACYVRNVLKITRYVPSRRCELLRLIIEKIVGIDLVAPRDQVQLAEGDEDEDDDEYLPKIEDELFSIDDLATDVVVASLMVRPMKHVEGHKLDFLMELLFLYIHDTCYDASGELNWTETRELYRELLVVFDQILLPTHASCHIQFILFYICSFRAALSESFLEHLWKKVVDPNIETVYRQAAVAYISSFLSRAKYLSVTDVIRVYLERMTGWIHMYIRESAILSTKADVKHHGTFYSVCQAVFYIFVFRHRALLAMRKGLKFCKSLNLPSIVNSRLNPLRVCHPTVTDTFASVARGVQVAFCDTIIERNRRCMLPEAGSEEQASRLGSGSGAANPLHLYFPFDPYVLTRSGRFISELYQEYEGAVLEKSDNGCISGSDMEFEETEYTECCENLPIAANAECPGSFDSTLDFFKHGRSPGFNRK